MWKQAVKGVIVFELAGLIGAYGLFKRLDSDKDFRYNLNQKNYGKIILSGYYWAHSQAGNDTLKPHDQEYFSSLDKKI